MSFDNPDSMEKVDSKQVLLSNEPVFYDPNDHIRIQTTKAQDGVVSPNDRMKATTSSQAAGLRDQYINIPSID